jgi:hypothetical protein
MLILKLKFAVWKCLLLWGKFFSFNHLMLDDLLVGLAVIQGGNYLVPFFL